MSERFLTLEVVNIREGGAGCVGGGEIPSLRGESITISDGESTFTVDVRDMLTMVVLHAIVLRLQFQVSASAAPTRSAPQGLSQGRPLELVVTFQPQGGETRGAVSPAKSNPTSGGKRGVYNPPN